MNPLLHDDMIVAPLGSGSRGNATYIGTRSRGVLIDCGLSTKQIFNRLSEIGLGDVELLAVLLTHEHSDHVGSAAIFDRTFTRTAGHSIPFYMTQGTRAGLHSRCVPSRIEILQSGSPFWIDEFIVEPWTIPHDTHDPVAFAVGVGELRAGVITDLGRSTRLVERQLGSLDIAVLEFNHDLEMLLEGDYPWRLKQRVRGAHGHLSNAQAAEVLKRSHTGRLKHLILGHLSADNNRPELARDAANRALHQVGASGVAVHIACQSSPLPPIGAPQPTPHGGPATEAPLGAPQLSLFC